MSTRQHQARTAPTQQVSGQAVGNLFPAMTSVSPIHQQVSRNSPGCAECNSQQLGRGMAIAFPASHVLLAARYV